MAAWFVLTLGALGLWGLWGFFTKLGSDNLTPKSAAVMQGMGATAVTFIVLAFMRFKPDWDTGGSTAAFFAGVFLMAGIIASMPVSFLQIWGTPEFWSTLLFIAGIWAVVVYVVVFMHKGARRIPVQYARLTRGRRVYGGQRHYLPLNALRRQIDGLSFNKMNALHWHLIDSIAFPVKSDRFPRESAPRTKVVPRSGAAFYTFPLSELSPQSRGDRIQKYQSAVGRGTTGIRRGMKGIEGTASRLIHPKTRKKHLPKSVKNLLRPALFWEACTGML